MKNKGEQLAAILQDFKDCYFFLHNTKEFNVVENIMNEGFVFESQLSHSSDRVNPNEPIEVTYFMFQRKDYGTYTIIIAIPKIIYDIYTTVSNEYDTGVEDVMTINDPISDMLTRVRNAVMAGQAQVAMPSSKIKAEIAKILKDEGFLDSFDVVDADDATQRVLRLKIKYVGDRRERRPVLSGIVRVSSPGRRIYTRKTEIPWVLSGLGVAILSTPKGVMTGARARQLGVGGEILCKVW